MKSKRLKNSAQLPNPRARAYLNILNLALPKPFTISNFYLCPELPNFLTPMCNHVKFENLELDISLVSTPHHALHAKGMHARSR